jgi:Fur family ferric uptake transcriptional regulator
MSIQILNSRIDGIKQLLLASSYKLTHQREATVRVLLENEQDHLSAEEIFMLVREEYPDIGLATVYRTVELLCELHVVEKVNFGDGVARYDLRNENNLHHHHHIICVKCGAVDEIMEDWLTELEQRTTAEFGFQVLDHRLDFQGICYRCKDKPEL